MQKVTALKAGVGATVAFAMSLGMMTPAHADIQPTLSDAVGVGSDTVQYLSSFLDDGTGVFGTAGSAPLSVPGFNTVGKANRIFSFDATADGSGRNGYLKNSATALNNQAVLRQGQKPQVRPNGSGAGISALLADSDHRIDFVRSSRLPNATEKGDSRAVAFGGFHVYRIATDGMNLAVNNITTNLPSGETDPSVVPTNLSNADLANIYTGTYLTWGDVVAGDPAVTVPSAYLNDDIIPVIPQVGSGTRNDFLTSLGLPTSLPTANPNLVTGEEHDPLAITGIVSTTVGGHRVSAQSALSPFSLGRFKLINATTPATTSPFANTGGYFSTTLAQNSVALLTGAGDYNFARELYIVVREADVTSTTKFVTGGTQNLVQTFFSTSTSWYNKPANNALYVNAGVVRAFLDKGNNP